MASQPEASEPTDRRLQSILLPLVPQATSRSTLQHIMSIRKCTSAILDLVIRETAILQRIMSIRTWTSAIFDQG